MNCRFPSKNAAVAGVPLDFVSSVAHSALMRQTNKCLLVLCLACLPLFAQPNPGSASLHDALVLEQEGHFESAAGAVNLIIDSHQLTGVQLGRAYVMLGFAYHQLAKLAEAESAFRRALRIFEHDPEHVDDYATALNDYAGTLGDAGQSEAAAAMWRKAFHLHEQLGDRAAAVRSLLNLSYIALAQKHLRQARELIHEASDEMKMAPDLTDDNFALLSESQAWLALAEGRAYFAVTAFQRALDFCVRTRGERDWLTGWEYALLGNAYAQSRDLKSAVANMQKGLAILDHAVGRTNPKYFIAEMAYSEVLDRAGSHAEAARLREAARQDGKDFYKTSCMGCTIDVGAFR